jgi:hypothetical protein
MSEKEHSENVQTTEKEKNRACAHAICGGCTITSLQQLLFCIIGCSALFLIYDSVMIIRMYYNPF